MSSKEDIKFSDVSVNCLQAKNGTMDAIDPCGVFKITCHDSNGNVRWEEDFLNLVVNAGRNDILNRYFLGSSYTASFFVGIKGVGTISSTDTMASKSWSEVTAYSNATRPTYTVVTSTARAITNSASPAVFNINNAATVAGCFIVTNNTIGGTGGTLFSAADFASTRIVAASDTLTVTYQVTC